MSLHPSYISPRLDFSEPPPPPLKPGKLYGIVSIFCGLCSILPLISLAVIILSGEFELIPMSGGLLAQIIVILLSIMLFTIAGIYFGIRGLGTKGRCYAIIGLVISSLSALQALGVIAESVLAMLLA